MTADKGSTVKTVEDIWNDGRECGGCEWCERESTVSEFWGATGVTYETYCMVLENGLNSDDCPAYASQEVEEECDEAEA